jgi:hypothetical protein
MHIKDEWRAAARRDYYSLSAGPHEQIEAMLKAVAPLIRDAALEDAAA